MRPIAALLVLLAASACGGGGGGERGANQKPATKPAVARGPLGQASIAGTVSFKGTPPANPSIDMSEEPGCKAKYSLKPHDPAITVRDGKLSDVFVYVKSGLPAGATPPARTEPVSLEQDGCLYHPRVFGVMVF